MGLFDFLSKNGKKEETSFVDNSCQAALDKAICEVTTGILGTKEESFYDLWTRSLKTTTYSYANDKLSLEYTIKERLEGLPDVCCSAYYCDEKVYESTNNSYFGPSKENMKPLWVEELIDVIVKHRRATEEHNRQEVEERKRRKAKSEEINLKYKVISIFEYVYPDGYSDDKIIIDNLSRDQKFDYSYCDGGVDSHVTETYYGRISLCDGTVVCEIKAKGIEVYHPGMWEIYVSNLAEEMRLRRLAKMKENEEKRKRIQEEKDGARQKTYMKNHSPIDDHKYFE